MMRIAATGDFCQAPPGQLRYGAGPAVPRPAVCRPTLNARQGRIWAAPTRQNRPAHGVEKMPEINGCYPCESALVLVLQPGPAGYRHSASAATPNERLREPSTLRSDGGSRPTGCRPHHCGGNKYTQTTTRHRSTRQPVGRLQRRTGAYMVRQNAINTSSCGVGSGPAALSAVGPVAGCTRGSGGQDGPGAHSTTGPTAERAAGPEFLAGPQFTRSARRFSGRNTSRIRLDFLCY
jgi:hypothetical protein